jgi:ADP-dependent NAD(P)H-hydrate dehydratase / NAD(P)H-hydrate epimerase
MNTLPTQLYSAAATRKLDQIAIKKYAIPGYTLMTKAGEAFFNLLQEKYPLAKRILVCCGAGNNAGDGYVVARLAKKQGFEVDVVSLIDPEALTGDAHKAYQDWKSLGYQLEPFDIELLDRAYVVVDALLGTGLDREVEGEWLSLIHALNDHSVPVLAVDVPSGLDANTGTVLGAAVEADLTLSFIGLNKGLFTHQAADYCGDIYFDDLGVPKSAYQQVDTDATLLNQNEIKHYLKPRRHSSHKGSFGHVLVIGGDYGMAGAVSMAAESALRAGAGMVSVVTRPEHVSSLVSVCPELMVRGIEDDVIPAELLQRATCIIVGPGLGQSDWANKLLGQVLQSQVYKVIDADALNLLNKHDAPRNDWVLTPHPGEAASLLDSNIQDIQENRFTSANLLQQAYGGVSILKGAGSIVRSENETLVCPYGNPGMATAGMGDVLTGIIAAFIAQGLDLKAAAEMAVLIHAKAGDLAATEGERGLLATDLFVEMRRLINPDLKK